MRQKIDLQVGVKYRGYGYINEYGEFDFIPEQTGIRKGKRKLIKEGDNYSVSETVNTVQVHIAIPKSNGAYRMFKDFMKIVDNILLILRDYEI